MLYYGDELGYLNDYSFQHDPAKSYDNRWMHRPLIDWEKAKKRHKEETVEARVFLGLKRLIQIRKSLPAISDHNPIRWINPHNIHVAGFLREKEDQRIFIVGNYTDKSSFLTWYAFKEFGFTPKKLWDHYSKEELTVAGDDQYLILEPYGFRILEVLT